MEEKIIAQLNRINQQFYQNFAESFSQTRHRIQPGVDRVLQNIPQNGNVLDIGCGNGNLGFEWAARGYEGVYCGVDFSEGLIAAARETSKPKTEDQEIIFLHADLTNENWIDGIPDSHWHLVCCFAVLHHIPGKSQREQLCRQIREIIPAGGSIWISVWQPLNSERLSKRIFNLNIVGISEEDLESGDVLMDWRAQQGKSKNRALRFVHIFTDAELTLLAESCGFSVKERFLSDGKEGNLGLYQKWDAK